MGAGIQTRSFWSVHNVRPTFNSDYTVAERYSARFCNIKPWFWRGANASERKPIHCVDWTEKKKKFKQLKTLERFPPVDETPRAHYADRARANPGTRRRKRGENFLHSRFFFFFIFFHLQHLHSDRGKRNGFLHRCDALINRSGLLERDHRTVVPGRGEGAGDGGKNAIRLPKCNSQIIIINIYSPSPVLMELRISRRPAEG